MSSTKSHPRCGARTRSGRRCRRYVAVDPWTRKHRKRCRLHGGLSTGPKFPDGKERSLAAANAGLARWRERMRAAKAAGLIERFPNGRKPGPSRRRGELEAEEREEALARRRVEFMDANGPPRWPARRGGSRLIIDLERLERTLIARLADRDPPPREQIEEVLGLILQVEEMFGRAVGKEERLACVSWAYNTWRERQALNEFLAQLAQQREAKAAQASARATDASAAPLAFEPPPSTGSTVQVAAEPLVHDDDKTAALARLTAEATELIASIRTRYTQRGCQIFDAELDRARDLESLVRGVEVTEPALRAAEIDLCRQKLEMIRASEAEIEARAERRRLRWLELEAKRARKRERGVPMTLPGWRPGYRQS